MANGSATPSQTVKLRREAAIAECAYYKAELRSFVPGHELEDWLAAEHELSNGEAKRKRVRAVKPVKTKSASAPKATQKKAVKA